MIERLAAPDQEWHASIQFVQWLQYHLHRQLLGVSQYAQEKRVALKGDLPIGEHARPAGQAGGLGYLCVACLHPCLLVSVVGGLLGNARRALGLAWGWPGLVCASAPCRPAASS